MIIQPKIPKLLDYAILDIDIDKDREIMITDSGELSIWLPAVKRADVFGTTMYRIVWSEKISKYFGYIKYPLPPRFFWFDL